MKGTVTSSTLDLRTEMGNLGTLLDEALDYIADMPAAPTGIVGNTLASPDVKEMLLGALMNRIAMPQNYGSTTQPQDGQNDEIETTQ